jgi:ribonuclease-3
MEQFREVDSLMQVLFDKLNYQFKNIELIQQAFKHSSIALSNNERLEFLGDAVLDCIISNWLFKNYPKNPEGELTSYRAHLVKTETLVVIADFLDVKNYLQFNSATLTKDSLPQSILADTVEAVFAAIFIDAGFELASKIVLDIYKKVINLKKLEHISKDPKTILQEYAQLNYKTLPQYQLQSTSGLEHAKQFVVKCYVPGLPQHTIGVGSSKRQAEKNAAEQLVSIICNENTRF